MPDHVLINIVSYLDLETQFLLNHENSCFSRILPYVWRKNYKTVNFNNPFNSPQHLKSFMKSTHSVLTTFRITMYQRQNFDDITEHVYPNVTDFRFATISFRLKDVDMKRIVKSFPKLQTFSPLGDFSGIHIKDLKCLQNLTLSYCSNMTVTHMQEILNTLCLKSLQLEIFDDKYIKGTRLPMHSLMYLESLYCYIEEMHEWFLKKFYLVSLKKLMVLGIGDYISVIKTFNHRSARVLQLRIKHWLFNSLSYRMTRIKTLIITDCQFEGLPISDVQLPGVKEVVFKNCTFSSNFKLNLFVNLLLCEVVCFDGCTFGLKKHTFSTDPEHRTTKIIVY
ncbi:hypothetical protein KR018_003866, partial [Drosophila ironensis]